MAETTTYDVAIIGGGLAGLALSIQLSKQQYKVVLFEKEIYPFHKVCGEYLSMESWDFLTSLGLPLTDMRLPQIRNLQVSSPGGDVLRQKLSLGGFGISRYLLDNELKKIALSCGVELYEDCKVQEVQFNKELFQVTANALTVHSRVCCGSFGKRSNIDIRMKRKFTRRKAGALNNYIGVKYHISTDFPADTIALHNFENGYCGVSKIENNQYCLCYLTTAANLQQHQNSIQLMEQQVLYKNKHLKFLFENSKILYASPVTISQISFSKKTQVESHVLMLGDAAGMISPLCGNGMSMALHGSKIAAKYVTAFLSGSINRLELEAQYSTAWRKTFAGRLRAGRWIQSFFGKSFLTNWFILLMKKMPRVTNLLIEHTHGKPF